MKRQHLDFFDREVQAAETMPAVGCSVVSRQASRVGDTAKSASDLRNRKQRLQWRCRPMSDGRDASERSSQPARSYAQVAAEVMPIIGVVERALNFIVSRQSAAALFVSRMLHRSIAVSCLNVGLLLLCYIQLLDQELIPYRYSSSSSWWGEALQKCSRLHRFKSDLDEIWHARNSS